MVDGRAALIAARDIAAGEAVISVQQPDWLGREAVGRSAIGKAVAELEPWLQLALLLVHERFQPSGSTPQASYVASLPSNPGSPLFWTEEQQQLLQGSQLMGSLQGYRVFYESRFQQLFGAQGTLSKGPFAAVFSPNVFSWPNFLWAAATVRARSRAPLDGDAIALVPLADAVSHRRNGNMVWKQRSAGLFARGQVLVVEAVRPVRKGEELSMDYGPDKLDATLLLDHGVLDTSSPKPGYLLSLALSESDRLLDDKVDILETAGLATTQSWQLQPNATPEQGMLAMLRLMQLQGGDAFLLESVFRNDVWGFMADPVSQDNEAAVCSSMMEGAQAALQGYPSSIDSDLALLRSGSLAPGSPEEMAVKVRLGEQESLDSLLQWFEERQTGLKRLAYYQERRLRRLGLIDDEGRTTYDSFFKDGIA